MPVSRWRNGWKGPIMAGSQTWKDVLNTPWKITMELRRLSALPHIRLYFALNGVAWGRGWRIYGCPIIQRHRGSTIELGAWLELRSWYATNPLAPNHPVVLSTRKAGAVIRVGDKCGLTGAVVVAAERVEIGNRVLLGANSVVTDTDFHPLDPRERQRDILNGQHSLSEQNLLILESTLSQIHPLKLFSTTSRFLRP